MPARPHIGTPLQDLSPRREDLEREGASGISDNWQPRERHQGSGVFAGSNAYLGSPDGIRAELQERVLGLEEALLFAAKCNGVYRRAKRARIVAYAQVLTRVGDSVGRGAAPRKLEADRLTARQKAREEDAGLAWDLARLACRTQEAELTAVQTAARMLKQQIDLDQGKNEQAGYNQRAMLRTAGRRQEGS